MRYQRGKWSEIPFDFFTVKQFHDWLDMITAKEKRCRIWMFSHNMAFDFPILELDNYFSRNGWESPSMFVPSTPFLYYTKKHLSLKDTIDERVVSTTNWYNWPLKKLAPIFGTSKMELSGTDFNKITDEELLPYCRQDTRVVCEIVKGHIKFVKDNDLGTVQATIAGQAFSAFRHRFMDVPLLVHHKPNLIKLELDAYKGGRTEAFQLGRTEGVYILDVNSMYPSVMRSNPYPIIPKCSSPINVNSNYLPTKWEDMFTIARCKIKLNEPCIGIHRETDGKLIFPIGSIRTTLTGPEISFIENRPELGEIVQYEQVAIYEHSDKVFTRYVDFFYDLKKNGKDDVTIQEAKLFLNSLYGKFGQRQHDDIEEAGNRHIVEDASALAAMKDLGISVLYEHGQTFIRSGSRVLVKPKGNKGEVSHNAMPRIAAAVTAYARLSLWEIIKTAELENVYYCDTDSIITNKDGLAKCQAAGFLDDHRLGALKVEGPYTLDCLSPKHYALDGKWKNKGIRKNAVQVGPNSWEQDSFKTGMSRYRDGVMDGVKVERLVKTCKDIVDKGTVDKKSGRVSPLVFHDF